MIYLNNSLIGQEYWDGSCDYTQEMDLPSNLLLNGENTLTIESPGDTGAIVDIIYLNRVIVNYRRFLQAKEDRLSFTAEGSGRIQFEVSNLHDPRVHIYAITDPYEVQEVMNISLEPWGSTNLYKAVFEDEVIGLKTYYVTTESHMAVPDDLALRSLSNLKDTDIGADYIMIAPKEFADAVGPLCALRQSQGLRVRLVAVEEIYNEFSYGIFSPEAIKKILAYAYTNWLSPAPTYVLLVGDANMDYRDLAGTGKKNHVPVHLSITSPLGLTPDDNWYVCVHGDDPLPDMLLGRIPAADAESAAALVNKIIDYESLSINGPKKVLLASDNNDPSYRDLNESLVSYLPNNFTVDKVYLETYQNTAIAKGDLIAGLDAGALITNYVGHGAVTNWAGEYLFSSQDVGSLNNGDNLTFAFSMNCLSGYFAQPFKYCLIEELVRAEGKGAIAGFAPSGLACIWEHEILDKKLFAGIFNEDNRILGVICMEAKIEAYACGMSEQCLRMFHVIGDPAAKLRINTSPAIFGMPPNTIESGGVYCFTPTVEGMDVEDKLSFSINNLPVWASFDTSTGALTGIPGDTDIGSVQGIIITVTDEGGLSISLPAFDLTILPVPEDNNQYPDNHDDSDNSDSNDNGDTSEHDFENINGSDGGCFISCFSM